MDSELVLKVSDFTDLRAELPDQRSERPPAAHPGSETWRAGTIFHAVTPDQGDC
jgi:hypothetical protein